MAKFCPNCGNPLSSEALKFCPECGASLAPCSAPNASTPNHLVVEKPAKEKIYYQDKYMLNVETNLLGKHNIYNLLLAIAVAIILKIYVVKHVF